jgi:hypothetical protein
MEEIAFFTDGNDIRDYDCECSILNMWTAWSNKI